MLTVAPVSMTNGYWFHSVKVCCQKVHSFLPSGSLSKALPGVAPGLPHATSYVYFPDSCIGFSLIVCSFLLRVPAAYVSTHVDFAKVGMLRLSCNTVLNYKASVETSVSVEIELHNTNIWKYSIYTLSIFPLWITMTSTCGSSYPHIPVWNMDLTTFGRTSHTPIIICVPLLFKSGAAPLQWCFPGVIDGLSWEHCVLLITVQTSAAWL